MTVSVQEKKGTITDAAPIVRKFINQPLENLERWMQRHGGFKKAKLKMAKSKIIHGDCIEEMQKFIKEGRAFDFIFCDPPFNIGHAYKGFEDKWESDAAFEAWCFQWLILAYNLLQPGGVLALHGPDKLAESYILFATGMRKQGIKRIAWVNWHYRFGQCNKSNWIDARCHCLLFTNGEPHTWNPEEVLVESDRVKYGDNRAAKTGGRRVPGTVWGVPSDGANWGRVTGSHSNKERRGNHPNQLPELYIARLLRAYTNPGDWVLDPFCGSGTVPTIAKALGRNCISFDVSKFNVKSAKRRLKKGAVRV